LKKRSPYDSIYDYEIFVRMDKFLKEKFPPAGELEKF